MATYYHITSIENQESILRNGLECDAEGNIYLLDSLTPCDSLAVNQIGLTSFSVFQISSKGLVAPLIPDEVAEFTADHQFICKQPTIEPRHIKLIGQRTIDPFAVATRDNIALYNVIEEGFASLDYKGKLLFLKERFQSNERYDEYLKQELQK